ncbi:MAG: NAD(P)-dependent oxidoreductase [Candidatus Cloacimonadales bacterium]
MSVKNTLVLDEMPDLFWELVKENNNEKYFTTEKLLFSEEIEIIILRTKSIITESHYKRFPNLKCIIRAGSGYDNIDVVKAVEYGITIQNTPEANVQSAFEHTLALIFSLIKNLKPHNNSVLLNTWREGIADNLEVSDLKVLVVGIGRVGSKVAEYLKLLGAEVRFVDPYEDETFWEGQDINSTSYQEGLQWCNLVTYHCPLYAKTHHYFSKSELSLLTQPIYLINAARGEIVDVDAVVKGIQDNKIIGAGIDVMENEPWQCEGWEASDRIILTPHTGAFTAKAKQRLSEECYSTWNEFCFNSKVVSQIKVW